MAGALAGCSALLWVRNLFRFYGRVAKSNFPFFDCAISPLGLPLFIWLLYRSWFQHKILKRVSWKGEATRRIIAEHQLNQ